MRHSYTEAFHFVDEEHPVMPAIQLLAEGPGVVQVRLNTVWLSPIAGINVDLQVPLVEPMRFAWDRGVFGHKVAFPKGAERYCLPRLMSPVTEVIATAERWQQRELFFQVTDWMFHWENFYDRIHRVIVAAYHDKLQTTMQQIRMPLVRTHFQRGISQLMNGGPAPMVRPTGWAENGAATRQSLPLTDEALDIRQMFEVELGYPDVVGDDWLYEQMKLEFLKFVDPGCDITFTGKNHTGRQVMRVHPDDPKSHVTGRPMSKLALTFNPLDAIGNPKRVHRENRSSCGALKVVNPIAPPIRSTAVRQVPEPFQERITTLNVAFFDVEGMNAWTADEETAELFPNTKVGEVMSLDGLLLTPTGRAKLEAYSCRTTILDEEEFLEHREGWSKLPGYREQEIPEIAEVMADGTMVCLRTWRCWHDEPIPAMYGKYKLTVGGIKGVGRPIHQLFCRVGGKVEPIDMVVSAQTVISKGSVDAILYALAYRAGITEVDPAWTREEIGTRVTAGLQKHGLPTDGCFEILRKQAVPSYGNTLLKEADAELFRKMGVTLSHKFEKVVLGRAIVGLVPVVVAPEQEFRQSNANKGVAVAIHPRLTQDLPFTHDAKTAHLVEKIGRFYMETTGA
jgi:hypothetical protein